MVCRVQTQRERIAKDLQHFEQERARNLRLLYKRLVKIVDWKFCTRSSLSDGDWHPTFIASVSCYI